MADLKTTSRSSLWASPDKIAQVRIYGLGLDYMEFFDCSELRLMIGVEHSDIREKLGYNPYEQDLSIIHFSLSEAREIGEVEKVETVGGYRRWIRDYDRAKR